MGVPKLLTDNDIQTELPADVDDENLTERGFQPALPGESTKLSSALALFRLARIISKVLQEVYSADGSRETSLQKIGALSDELDEWNKDLAPHLRLTFIQDKPSTNVISSRSPLLVSRIDFRLQIPHANFSLVSRVLLYSNFDSPSCCYLFIRIQNLVISDRPSRFKQAYNTDYTAS